MTPIEGTVNLIQTWSVTGKLSECNVGDLYDLTEQLFALFSAQKPKRAAKTPEKGKEQAKPTHVDMNEMPEPAKSIIEAQKPGVPEWEL